MNDGVSETKPDYVLAEFLDYGDARDLIQTNGWPTGLVNDGGGDNLYTS